MISVVLSKSVLQLNIFNNIYCSLLSSSGQCGYYFHSYDSVGNYLRSCTIQGNTVDHEFLLSFEEADKVLVKLTTGNYSKKDYNYHPAL